MSRPLLDHAVLDEMRQQIGGPALRAVLELFIGESRGFVATMRAGGDADAVRRAAHSLKSSAAQIGAAALSEIVQAIEAAPGDAALTAGLPAAAAATEAALAALLKLDLAP